MEPGHRGAQGRAPRSGRRIRLAAAALAVLTLAAFAASCSDSSDSESKSDSGSKSGSETTSTTAPAQPAAAEFVGSEAAVAKYVEDQGDEYVGDCADAQLPRDKGKWCSTLVSGDDASGTKTYAIGPVGEKPEKQITVTRRGAAQLTPGFQVGVAQGNVGDPQQLTAEQLANNTFILENLLLDQAAGIGNGAADLPAGAPPAAGGGTGGTGGTGGAVTPPVVVPEEPTTTEPYIPDGEIVVVDPVVDRGDQAVFEGSGCAPNELLSVSFDGRPAGTITADSEGKFAGALGVPPGTAPGVHTITVRGQVCVLNANVRVQGALAFTGSSSHTTTYVLAGFAAVVVGLVLVVGTRRRRRGVTGRRSSSPSAGP